MPIVTTVMESADLEQVFDESLIVTPQGELTPLGTVASAFLSEMNFDAFFDDEELREVVEVTEGYAKLEDGEWVECDEKDEGAQLVIIETLDSELVGELLDEADTYAMYVDYVNNSLPRETLEQKVFAHAAMAMLDEDDMLDEFAKGSFRKWRKIPATKGKKFGPENINRMLGAMLNKEAIQRAAKPGAGYKKGDYEKKPGGYGAGTAGGIKRWAKYKGGAGAAITAKNAKAATKKSVSVQDIKASVKGAGKKTVIKSLKGQIKPKANKKTAVAKVVAKKKAKIAAKGAVGKKTAKNIAASVEQDAANMNEDLDGNMSDGERLNESVKFAAGAVKRLTTQNAVAK